MSVEIIEENQLLDRIEADYVVIEVVDKITGQLFRRTLPLKFLENDNGIILSGETIAGAPTEIAFLSDIAISKLSDLRGNGPDFARCKTQ